MSTGTLSSSLSNQTLRTPSKPNFSSDILIKKPPTLADKCPIESQSNRFPAIEDRSQKRKSKQKSASSSDSSTFWLKPGISLPKLRSKNVPQETVKTGEPYTCFSYSNVSRKKEESKSGEISSVESVKCFQKKSEDFEVPSDVAGPSECQFLFKVPSSEINIDKLQPEDPIEEDNALKRWRIWTERHKRQQAYLSKRLKRWPSEFVFQKTNFYRQTVENKLLLMISEIPEADKWRGHPYHWIPPIEMKEKKTKVLKPHEHHSSPAYFLQKTLVQEGIVPDIEFIGTPSVIREEKGIESMEKLAYKYIRPNQKICDVFSTIEERIGSFLRIKNILRPAPENLDELVIVGTKFQKSPKEVISDPPAVIDVPVIKVTGPDDSSANDVRESVFWLIINGRDVKYELEPTTHRNQNEGSCYYTWELDFGVNEVSKRVERSFQIENKGTTAVRYKWVSKKLEETQNSNKLAPNDHEPWFFFNKNSGIFLPGQFYDFKFYYHSRKSGVRTETWYMKTTPPLYGNDGCATIILSAVASGDCSIFRTCILEAYLRGRLRESIVKYIIDIILRKVTSTTERLRELEYRSLFFEKELFEYHNSKYYYHSETVKELKKLFEKIPYKTQTNWDLSLDGLTKIISINTKGQEREFFLRNVCEVAKVLLKPNRVFLRQEIKYRMAYNILCKMTNFMEEDYDYLRKILSNKKRKVGFRGTWQYNEYEETVNSTSLTSEEKCDFDSGSVGSMLEIKTVNLIYFQTMFYIKVYNRVSEAVENIVGMLETRKKLESSGNIGYKLPKSSRTNRESDFFPCL